MTQQSYENYLEELLNKLNNASHISSKDIPNIDLYMDQVTTFMDHNLGLIKRNRDDKTLTKTMINNYSKFQLLPPNNKKKYSKNHIQLLILIYNLKHSLSIQDISLLLKPLNTIVLNEETELSLTEFFDALTQTEKAHFESYSDEILDSLKLTTNLFPNAEEKDKETLSLITTAYLLSAQASMYKFLATKLIDNYLTPTEEVKQTPVNKKNDKKSTEKKQNAKPPKSNKSS
jgi:DNA-binding transcriptional MerR regulator